MRGMVLRDAATKRIFGFEESTRRLLLLPICRLQPCLQIVAQGWSSNQRAGVVSHQFVDWLEKEKVKQLVLPEFPALRSEAEAAASVKHEAKILVVIGNPPYRGPAGVAEDEEHDLIAPITLACLNVLAYNHEVSMIFTCASIV